MTDSELQSAFLRRAQKDLPVFFTALGHHLEASLPECTTVLRKKDGLFAKTTHVHEIVVTLESFTYKATLNHGQLLATRAKSVHGVTLKTESMPPAAWFAALQDELSKLSDEMLSASQSLHDLVMG